MQVASLLCKFGFTLPHSIEEDGSRRSKSRQMMASALRVSAAGAAVVSVGNGSRISNRRDGTQARSTATSAPARSSCRCCTRIRTRPAGAASVGMGMMLVSQRSGARQQRGAFVVVKAAGEGVEAGVETKVQGDVLPSADWPENFSLLNFEDLISHYEPALFKEDAQPGAYLANVMSKTVYTAFPDQKLSEINRFFDDVSGLPVIDQKYVVLGVLSKKDRLKAKDGENSLVKDLMSSPAITLSADKTVQDAAVLMLKNKIHRIPVVNSTGQVVGMVTRTDIFTALDTDPK